jgi:hypothetical protein
MITLNRTCGLLLLIAALVVHPAVAADAAPADHSKDVETRVYEVKDLLMGVRDYPLRSALLQPTQVRGREPAATPQPPSPATTQPSGLSSAYPDPQATLIRMIIDNVESTSWKDNGGDVGSLTMINDRLLITQTPENHAAIEKVLASLRTSAFQIVRIRVDWVLLDPGGVAAILAGGATDTSPTPLVNRASPALGKGAIAYSADISCFNGQTVHIASGRARTMTTAATAVVGQNAAAFDPITEIVQCGAALQATPVLTQAGTATIDLMSEVGEWQPPNPADANKVVTSTSANGLDRLEAIVQHFHTTVQVPINKPVLVGGMTFNPSLDAPAGKQLYLVLEADAGK